MPFKFDAKKSIQSIGMLLKFENKKQMNYMRILKLIYISDRESLRARAHPITGDYAVAMQHGPVPSKTYDLMRSRHQESAMFDRYFRIEGYELVLNECPGNSSLSPWEIEILRSTSEEHRFRDEWNLSRFTHKFDEWKRNNPDSDEWQQARPGSKQRPIPLEHIIEAVGLTDHKDSILRDSEDERKADRVFGVNDR